MGNGRVVSAEGWRDGGGSVRLLAQLGDCYEQRREAGMLWGKPEVLHWENSRWYMVMSSGTDLLTLTYVVYGIYQLLPLC